MLGLMVAGLLAVVSTAKQVPVVYPTNSTPLPLDIQPLSISGPSNNRVDLIFLSDGYLEEERNKFFSDAKYLADDISANQTYNTVRPLLNFWAAFTPSKESGVGTEGKTKDTPFGLYRDGTELRGVWCNNTDLVQAVCDSLGDSCDYPIALGNSPLYGGSGGFPTVITASFDNGPLVLRHELGHSIIDVGEEYDGSDIEGYFGVNAMHNLSGPVSWAHWFTDPDQNQTRVERSVMTLQDYAWTMLNVSSSWKTNFSSSGTYSRYIVRSSLSGLPSASDLTVKLDGQDLGWEPRKDIGVDRWFYDLYQNDPLSDGTHEIEFTLNNSDLEGTAQLCSVEVMEYGTEEEFISTPGHHAIYPTYSDKNETAYRPTNEDCLMRLVTTPTFCSVCMENLWRKLLEKVNLIDDITSEQEPSSSALTLEAHLIPFGQLRMEDNLISGDEAYTISWSRDGKHLDEFDNLAKIEVGCKDAKGVWKLEVELKTPEVRKDPDGLLKDTKEYDVTDGCAA